MCLVAEVTTKAALGCIMTDAGKPATACRTAQGGPIMGKTRAEVAKKLTEALRDLDRGVVTPRNERQTLGAYLDTWLVNKKTEIEPIYWLRCEQYVRLHIKPALGKVALVKVTAQHLTTLYAQKLEVGAAANTVRHLHATIHAA